MPDRLTDEQIKELKKLEKEATPGPWRAGGYNGTETVADVSSEHHADGTEWSEATEGFKARVIIQRDGGIYPPREVDEKLIRALRNAAPALLDEVEEARRILSAPRWSGLISSVGEDEKPATRIGPGGYSAPDKDRAASAMLAALMDAARRGNIVAEERLKAVIAIAHAAGIRPG